MTSRDQPQQHGVGGVEQTAIATAKRHLRDCMEAPDWPVHTCYATCNDLSYLLAEVARLRARCASLEAVAEAAKVLYRDLPVITRDTWMTLRQALAALDQHATTTQEGNHG